MSVVPDRERGRGVPDFRIVWDLIQKGCGYPNRNKAWKGVPVNVKEALVILKGQNSAKSRLPKFETRHTPQTVKF